MKRLLAIPLLLAAPLAWAGTLTILQEEIEIISCLTFNTSPRT